MKIRRFWVDDIIVPDYWWNPLQLAKHRIYMYLADSKHIRCDEMGFRISNGFNSLLERYRKTQVEKKIFCFGGSTTFGVYCRYKEAFPYHLERLSDNNTAVFNLGLGGADIKGSLDILVDVLRLGMIPDLAIFLDGINEKQAWFQGKYGYEEYQEVHYQYHPFLRLIKKANKYSSILNFLHTIKKGSILGYKENDGEGDAFHFIAEQSSRYIKTKNTIERLANEWSFRTLFVLQPTVFDFVQDQLYDESKLRYQYLKALYRSILAKSENTVIDISQDITLEPEMFIDWQHCNAEGNKIIANKIFELEGII